MTTKVKAADLLKETITPMRVPTKKKVGWRRYDQVPFRVRVAKAKADLDKYVNYIQSRGFFAEGIGLIGVDVVQEISDGADEILKKYPNANFFGGQLVFPEEIVFTRWLHNYTVFAIQRRFYYKGIPIILLPIRL